jgi:hypothetical protein
LEVSFTNRRGGAAPWVRFPKFVTQVCDPSL